MLLVSSAADSCRSSLAGVPRGKLWTVCSLLSLLLFAGCGSTASTEIVPKWPINNVRQAKFAEDDWPCWRGPAQNGVAQGPPAVTQWSEKQNVVWATEIPGRGHSSPIVVGKQIFLTTSDEKLRTQSVVCLHRKTGNHAWITKVHDGGLDPSSHQKNTQATPTMVCDTERVFALFMFDSRVQLTALDLLGNVLWKTVVGNYVSKFGYSASPLLHGPLVIVAVDHGGGGYLAGVNRYTGEIYWRTPRPPVDSYCTPAIYLVAGKETLFIAGNNEFEAYDPLTGKKLWGIKGTTEACVGSPVQSEDIILASGGYPGRETLAVKIMPDGKPKVLWRNTMKSYVPSLLAHAGTLYQVTDGGVGSCWDIDTGRKNWETRLGGDFSSSPVLSGDHVYVSNEKGTTQVFKASPKKFELVARNQLGNEQMASPAICGGRIFIRAATTIEDQRQEYLYCIGTPDPLSATSPPDSPPPEQGGQSPDKSSN